MTLKNKKITGKSPVKNLPKTTESGEKGKKKGRKGNSTKSDDHGGGQRNVESSERVSEADAACVWLATAHRGGR